MMDICFAKSNEHTARIDDYCNTLDIFAKSVSYWKSDRDIFSNLKKKLYYYLTD